MNKKKLPVLGIIIVAFAILAIYRDMTSIEDEALFQPWKVFRAEESNFEVLMPEKNIIVTDSNNIGLFKGKTYEVESYGCIYRVQVGKISPNLSNDALDSILYEVASSTLGVITGGLKIDDKNPNAPSISSHTFLDNEMKVVAYRWIFHPVAGQVRLYKSYVYNLLYQCQDEDAYNKTIRDKFLWSLKPSSFD